MSNDLDDLDELDNHCLPSERTERLETLSAKQTFELTEDFKDSRYLTNAKRSELAALLDLGEELIEAWFERKRQGANL